MRFGGFSLESFKFGVYIVAPLVAVYVFSVPEVFTGVITNRSYITYRPQVVIDDEDEDEEERDDANATEADLDDATSRRIEAYVRVGQEEQRAQLQEMKKRLQADLAAEAAEKAAADDEPRA